MILLFSFISQLVYALQPGKQTLNYYRCKHIEMPSEINKNITKFNWTMVLVLIFSIAIHIILNIRIKLYKYNLQKYFLVLQKSEQTKQNILCDIDNKTIVDFSKSSFTVVLSASVVYSLAGFVNRMHPMLAVDFPNNMIVFLYNCIIPCSVTSVFLLVYYLRNFILIKSLCREIKKLFGF